MKTLFDDLERARLVERLHRLGPDSKARWGSMGVLAMLRHQIDTLRYALGELEAKPRGGPMAHRPLNWLLIHKLPWPKGKAPSPPEFLSGETGDWNTDAAQLERLIQRAGERGPNASWPISPAFGRITGKDWGVLGWRHVDHHLRQFGG